MAADSFATLSTIRVANMSTSSDGWQSTSLLHNAFKTPKSESSCASTPKSDASLSNQAVGATKNSRCCCLR